jgi:parvulin-like peptidyl-prolyl isomerase
MADAVTARPAPLPVPPAGNVQGPGSITTPIVAPAPVQAIATVNGRTVPYSAWLNLMKRSQGLSAFQQILAVELSRQAAEAKGIFLTEPQLETAFRQEIADVVGPETKDAAESERILRVILTRRGLCMDEFRLSAYRNAYLRRIAEPTIEAGINDDALKVQFDRLYGPKVQVRHIQVSDSASVNKIMEALQAGQDFSDLVRQYSQNLDSVPDDGLLAPFSQLDPSVPPEVREVAFGMEVGKVSGPVRVDGWTQILRLEKRLPAEPVEHEKVAAEVRRSLKEQLVRQKMQDLLRNMLQSASIQVYDEELGKQFQALRQAKP